MTNQLIETTIVLGTVELIVALFANAYNKKLKLHHEKEIESIDKGWYNEINIYVNANKKLQDDINTLISDTSSEDDKRLIRKFYLNKISMREGIKQN